MTTSSDHASTSQYYSDNDDKQLENDGMDCAYVCQTCYEEFDTKTKFESHSVKQHGQIVPYRCVSDEYDQVKYSNSDTDEGECRYYQCSKCMEKFDTETEFVMHSRKFHGKVVAYEHVSDWFHGDDGVSANNSAYVESNFQIVNESDDDDVYYECEDCMEEPFDTKTEFEMHSRLIHGRIANYRCVVIHDVSPTSFKFDLNHTAESSTTVTAATGRGKSKRNKLAEKPYKCNQCDKSYTTKGNLRVHVKKHQQPQQFECSVCLQMFATRQQRRHHMTSHTGDKLYPCSLCDRKFSQRSHLKTHEYTHSDAKNFKCTECDRYFRTPTQLKNHAYIHRERRHQCDACGKKFHSTTNLKIHQRIHTNEEPYQCEFCHKRFLRYPKWKHHVQRHTGSKPHVCDVCGKGFPDSYLLKYHQRKHTGERPYQCDKCDKSFTLSSSARRHMKNCRGDGKKTEPPSS